MERHALRWRFGPKIRGFFSVALEHIERRCAHFPRYAVPRAVHLVRDAWTIDNGFMTPTLKLKRKPLMAHYSAAIEALYQKR